MKTEPLAGDELQRAKDYLKGSMLLGLESSTSRMSNLARQEMYFGRHVGLNEIARRVDSVTATDVLAVANDLLDPSRLGLTILGPMNGVRMGRADLKC